MCWNESLRALTLSIDKNKGQQLAFLINAYNASTLQLIIDHYPVKSIKDIGGWAKGP